MFLNLGLLFTQFDLKIHSYQKLCNWSIRLPQLAAVSKCCNGCNIILYQGKEVAKVVSTKSSCFATEGAVVNYVKCLTILRKAIDLFS